MTIKERDYPDFDGWEVNELASYLSLIKKCYKNKFGIECDWNDCYKCWIEYLKKEV